MMLTLLKFSAIALSSILGILGTTTETHDRETHKLTRSGFWTIVLIVLGTLVALYAQTMEVVQAADAALEATEKKRVDDCRALQLLNNAERLSHPFANSLEVHLRLSAAADAKPQPSNLFLKYFETHKVSSRSYNGGLVPLSLQNIWKSGRISSLSLAPLAGSYDAEDPRRRRLHFEVELPELRWDDLRDPVGPFYGVFARVGVGPGRSTRVRVEMRARATDVYSYAVSDLTDLSYMPLNLTLSGPLADLTLEDVTITEPRTHRILVRSTKALKPRYVKPPFLGRPKEAYYNFMIGQVGNIRRITPCG
jgi:hypothetical protein